MTPDTFLLQDRPPAIWCAVYKPSGSGFVSFHHPQEFPRGVDIVHKLKFGYVDLQLRGMGNQLNAVRGIFGTALDNDMTIEQAAKSAAIRINVPKIRADQGMSQQRDNACIGIDTAERLREWFLRHEAKWRSIRPLKNMMPEGEQ